MPINVLSGSCAVSVGVSGSRVYDLVLVVSNSKSSLCFRVEMVVDFEDTDDSVVLRLTLRGRELSCTSSASAALLLDLAFGSPTALLLSFLDDDIYANQCLDKGKMDCNVFEKK